MDSTDDDGAQGCPGSVADPLLYLPCKLVEQSNAPRGATKLLGPAIDPVRLVHALNCVRHLRSPKYFEVAVDDAFDHIFQDEEAE